MIIPLAINASANDRKTMKSLIFICIDDIYRPINPMTSNKGANRFFEEVMIMLPATAIEIRTIAKAAPMS